MTMISEDVEILARNILKHRSRLPTQYQKLATFLTCKIYQGTADEIDISLAGLLFKKTGISVV